MVHPDGTGGIRELSEEEDFERLLLDTEDVADLQELKRLCAERDRFQGQAELILADEYGIMATRNEAVLKACGVDVTHLPEEINQKLDQLVDLAMALRTRDACTESLVPAMCELNADLAKSQLEYTQLLNMYSRLERQKNTAASKMAQLERQLTSIQEQEPACQQRVHSWSENISTLKHKHVDYLKRLEHFELELKQSGVVDEQHILGDIQQLQHHHDRLRDEVEQKSRQLAAFQELPADLELARLKLEERRMELDQLEHDRECALKAIASSIQIGHDR